MVTRQKQTLALIPYKMLRDMDKKFSSSFEDFDH